MSVFVKSIEAHFIVELINRSYIVKLFKTKNYSKSTYVKEEEEIDVERKIDIATFNNYHERNHSIMKPIQLLLSNIL